MPPPPPIYKTGSRAVHGPLHCKRQPRPIRTRPTHYLRSYTHNQVTAPRRGPPRFSNTVLETFLRRRFCPSRLSFLSSSLSSVDGFKEYNIDHDDHHCDNVRNSHPQVGTRTRSSTPLVQSADGPRSGLRVFGQRKEDERPEETRWHADRLHQKHLRQVFVVLRRIKEFAGLQVSIYT